MRFVQKGGPAGGGSSGSSPAGAGLAASGLVLSLQASQGTSVVGGVVTAWANQAKAGDYWIPITHAGTPNATGINGLPTIDYVDTGVSSPTNYGPAGTNTTDFFASPEAFSIGGIIQYTGAKNFTAGSDDTPNLLGGNLASGFGAIVGLDPGDPTKNRFGLWIADSSSTIRQVESAQCDGTKAHYFVATFGSGTLSIYVDTAAVVTAGPFTNMTLANLKGCLMFQGSNQVSINANFKGHILELDMWNRALSASEISTLLAFYKSIGGF